MIRKDRLMMAFVVATAVLNGSVIGYDQSMIQNLNINDRYLRDLKLDANLLGLNVAILSAGSIAGGLFSGQICDRLGRRWGIAVSVFITLAAVAIQTAAPTEAVFCVGRFLLGIAITLNGTAAPVLVMELAPTKHHGVLGALYTCIWYLPAILVSAVALKTYHIDSSWSWRGLSVGQAILPLLSLPLIYLLPESPRWLILQGREDEAFKVLVDYHANGNAEDAAVLEEFHAIRDALTLERNRTGGWRKLVAPSPNLKRCAIVLAFYIFPQLTGVNTAAFYFGQFLDSAGVTSLQAQYSATIALNAFSLVCCIVGALAIDIGTRKARLGIYMVIATATLVIVGTLIGVYGVSPPVSVSYATVAMIFLLSGAFSLLWQPLQYVYAIEIFSYAQRARGMAVAQAVSYAFGFLNQYTTPIALANIGWRYYAINAGWNVVIAALIAVYFVETKGLSLEECEGLFEPDAQRGRNGSLESGQTVSDTVEVREKEML